MKRREFMEYMASFETRVIVAGLEREWWRVWDDISIRDGAKAYTRLGRTIGTRFVWDHPAAIDYFGCIKKSTRFMREAVDLVSIYGIRTQYVPVVHFQNVGMDDVAELCPELLPEFPAYKEDIMKLKDDVEIF